MTNCVLISHAAPSNPSLHLHIPVDRSQLPYILIKDSKREA